MEFINSEWDYNWFPLAYIYFGQGREGKKEEEGGKEGKEKEKGKEKGMEGKAGEVLKEGEEDKGEDKEKGKGGGGRRIRIIFLL